MAITDSPLVAMKPPTTELDEFGNPKKKGAVNSGLGPNIAMAAPSDGAGPLTAQKPPSTLQTQDPNNPNANVGLSKEAMAGNANWNTNTTVPANPNAPADQNLSVSGTGPLTAQNPPSTQDLNNQNTIWDTTTGNTSVLEKAQRDVLNQPGTSALQDATTKQAMNWVNNPMGDFDPAKTKQAALEKSNADWANVFESQRQQYGNVSGSGLLQKNMLQNALQHNVDQQAYEGQLDTENYNRYVDSLGKSIGTAQSVNQGNENIFSQRLGNLGTVRGMAEGERNQTTGFQENVALTNLGFDHATQLAAQQHGFDLEKMNTQYGHDIAMLMANQDWQGAQNKMAQDFQMAMQSNDINAVSANIDKQIAFDKWRQENGQEFTAEQNAMNRALEMSLKTMDVQGQSDLMNLKAKLDMNQLVAAKDFDAVQAALDRAQQSAMLDKTGAQQKELVKLQAEVDKAKQEAQNKFADSQRIATQSWQTGEAVRGEDAAKAAQYFDWQQKNLAQANDLEGQKALATLKNSFDLNIKTQDMAHDEKMLYLKNQYDEAMAQNDLQRQKSILNFTYTQDIAKMALEQGYETAKITMQGDIQKALQQGDFAHAEAMQQALFAQQTKENAADRSIDQARVALEAKGLNMQQVEADYAKLESQVQAGLLNPSVLTDFVNKTLSTSGVVLTPPDPLAAQKEADKEFAGLQQEYARTHPGAIGPDGKMTPEALKDFNEFVNKTMYGEGTTGSEEATTQKGIDALNDPAAYQALLNDPTVKEWKPEMSYNSGGFWGVDSRSFVNAPSKGSLIKYGGTAYEVISDVAMETSGENAQFFTVKNLKDGTTHRISISGNSNGHLQLGGF